MTKKILTGAVGVVVGDIVKFAGLDYKVVKNSSTFIGEREMILESTLVPTRSSTITIQLYNETVLTIKRTIE
jgi:hypothetical protein